MAEDRKEIQSDGAIGDKNALCRLPIIFSLLIKFSSSYVIQANDNNEHPLYHAGAKNVFDSKLLNLLNLLQCDYQTAVWTTVPKALSENMTFLSFVSFEFCLFYYFY